MKHRICIGARNPTPDTDVVRTSLLLRGRVWVGFLYSFGIFFLFILLVSSSFIFLDRFLIPLYSAAFQIPFYSLGILLSIFFFAIFFYVFFGILKAFFKFSRYLLSLYFLVTSSSVFFRHLLPLFSSASSSYVFFQHSSFSLFF